MNKTLLALSVSLLLASQGCSDSAKPSEPVNSATSSAVQAVEQTASEQYLAMVDAFFNDQLKLEPIYATFVGVNDYNDQFGGSLTEEYLTQRHQLNSRYFNQAKTIDISQLPPSLKLSYDMFVYDRNMELIGETYPERFLPINQFYSTVFTMVQLGTGESAQPFKTVTDYQNWLSRLRGFIKWTELAQQRMDEGVASKVVLPRVLVEKIIPQLDAQLVGSAQDSLFYSPINLMPDTFSDKEKAELTEQYQSVIDKELLPALSKLRTYVSDVYLPNARASDGWWGLPNGKDWYQHLANSHTTTTLPVDEIHQIGLTEVARILSEMDKVREQVGFKGDLTAFFASLSSEPQYFFTDKQDLIDGYMTIKDTINAVLPQYFDVMPKADYIVKPVEAFREKSAAGASYESPAVDGSRPGIFYINTYNLKAQPKWGMTTLSLHEAAPGHHFQIAIKQELTDVPQFQRFQGYTAFEEGWALYAEYLGIEMGVFNDPYQYFGKLSDEMLRAMRLVVDTGLHAKGWSREQAIQYMKDNSPMAESDIVAEVERYMAIPGQALSYKVGQLTILRLRADAEKALGDKFDLKGFHAQLLTTGSLPMAVMENKIADWIKTESAK
ncbi:DUF885 domain-containing protein [Shewanella inventionis]|uniref:DUF885 domain-containing protein n=1 Tax=Shewanella inventionis TaxID=1738770 RepID=A0ABQ1JDN0_9GAMM|nr:DUF885 domain-containing protein [Shewanella inventionis]MCL1158142.1 DUF885 domain-containing protein [Shewanella inventionis]UAL42374.1 DUF885 domain-containing protein [Shewanella inventionis]GGB64024.1 hypothetical protein GCM10011607_25960 [Shewanella inventionis]